MPRAFETGPRALCRANSCTVGTYSRTMQISGSDSRTRSVRNAYLRTFLTIDRKTRKFSCKVQKADD